MNELTANQLRPLGKVIDTHGLRGELKVRTHPQDQGALLAACKVYLQEAGAAPRSFELKGARRQKGYLVIQLKGCDHISMVAGLVGQDLLVSPADINSSEEELFWYELDGLRVVDQQRGEIGTLEDMFVTAAHGIYVVAGPAGEVLIPAIEPFVLGLDREAGVLRVDVPDGLFPESQ